MLNGELDQRLVWAGPVTERPRVITNTTEGIASARIVGSCVRRTRVDVRKLDAIQMPVKKPLRVNRNNVV